MRAHRCAIFLGRRPAEEVAVVRCPSCYGLRTISYRNRDTAALCAEPRRQSRIPPGLLRVVARTLQRGRVCGDRSAIWGPVTGCTRVSFL